MTRLSFDFPESLHQIIDHEQTSVAAFITEVLNTPDNKGKPNLKNLAFNLRFNHAGEGGSPEIVDLEVTGTDYDAETQKGQVTINYRVERHYTCSDVKSQQKHTEICPFEINTSEQILVLQIPEDESRDTVFEL
ncbi:hypothetical protein [Mucilaginibacter celer]|uniref:Uncharacterized protein n=1 Tax=Mucilaginibacter celer TaxID=2305508 RepID=A0A494VMA8_9SPHI|nr:hypothetical protein [Mucilaginibacter celer]AYL94050.1 hypothetical protein HYN43_001505 [Mucilaginibacter celer]